MTTEKNRNHRFPVDLKVLALIAALGSMAPAGLLRAQQQPAAGSLLDGLTPPRSAAPNPAEEMTPAEVKLNEGVPKLTVSLESGGGKKVSRHYHMVPGYVLLKSGQRMDGEVSLRAMRTRDDKYWHLTEVQFRSGKDQPKQKIAGAEVEDFVLYFTIDDYSEHGKRVFKDPAQNFCEGTITLADGTETHGLVALYKYFGDGVPGGGGEKVYFARNQTANIEEFRATAVEGFTQVRPDGRFEFLTYNGSLMPVIVNGKNFRLFRNPRPTTRATGFLAGLRSMGGDVLQDQAERLAAKGAAKQEMTEQLKNGQDLRTAAEGARQKANEAVEQTDNAFSGIDLRGFKPEYVIRNNKTGFEVVVSNENLAAQAAPLMDACPVTAKMDKKHRKDLMKFSNLEKLVQTLDQCF